MHAIHITNSGTKIKYCTEERKMFHFSWIRILNFATRLCSHTHTHHSINKVSDCFLAFISSTVSCGVALLHPYYCCWIFLLLYFELQSNDNLNLSHKLFAFVLYFQQLVSSSPLCKMRERIRWKKELLAHHESWKSIRHIRSHFDVQQFEM